VLAVSGSAICACSGVRPVRADGGRVDSEGSCGSSESKLCNNGPMEGLENSMSALSVDRAEEMELASLLTSSDWRVT